MKRPIPLLIYLVPLLSLGQAPDSTRATGRDTAATQVFHLGEVTVQADRRIGTEDRLFSEEMAERNRLDVAHALDLLPGVSLTASGPRNESMVAVRGFDLRAVPVYMDGIPVYVPYDGYADLARFTTADLAVIDVAKGFAPLRYGPNSLGGAINLISRRPVKRLEYDGALGLINANGYRTEANVGSNLGHFYVQAGYTLLHRDSYTLSQDFTPSERQGAGERDNSYRTDRKVSVKVGWTPTDNQEYTMGYINQHGTKGTPVYVGSDPLNSLLKKPRYWQWPNWDKETWYFVGNTRLDSASHVKARLYLDRFTNALFSYDDDTYTTQNKPSSFRTWYNDRTYGGSIEYGTTRYKRHELTASVHYKVDLHRENDLGEPVQHVEDRTAQFTVEDAIRLGERYTAIVGAGYALRGNVRAEDYNSTTGILSEFPRAGTSGAFNAQAGLFHTWGKERLGLTASRRTRFATIKDRYSYRMGTAIPNTGLAPETANQLDLTWTTRALKGAVCQASAYYTFLTDAIINVNNVEPGRSQLQNTGRADFFGVDASIGWDIRKNTRMDLGYSYIERHDRTEPERRFTDVPWTKAMAAVRYRPGKRLQLVGSTEYNAVRYSTSYGTRAPGFTLVNAQVSVAVWKHVALEAGVNNLFDENYMLVEGFPEEGRNFNITLRFFDQDRRR